MSRNASSQPPQSITNSTLAAKLTTSAQESLHIFPSLDSDQTFFYADPPIISQHKDAPRIAPLRPEYYLPTAEMMTHRDLGYGYMPQAVPAYPATQSHYSNLAAMSGYYQDIGRHLSTSPNPGYVSSLSYPRYPMSTGDREKVQDRRRRNSAVPRHQNKLLARNTVPVQTTESVRAGAMTTSRLPSVMGIQLEESPIQTSPDDVFTTQASLQAPTYTADHYARSTSYEPSPSLRGDEYRAAPLPYNMPQQAMSSSPSYPAYTTMASLNQSMPSLAPPPIIPSPSPQHYTNVDRSSPLLTTPIQGPPHTEPIMIDTRRDKPQCWEHGCNGREFSTFSNLLRHQREKSGSAAKAYCPRCGAEFTRTTARNGHMEHGKCKSRRASVAGNSTISQTSSGGRDY